MGTEAPCTRPSHQPSTSISHPSGGTGHLIHVDHRNPPPSGRAGSKARAPVVPHLLSNRSNREERRLDNDRRGPGHPRQPDGAGDAEDGGRDATADAADDSESRVSFSSSFIQFYHLVSLNWGLVKQWWPGLWLKVRLSPCDRIVNGGEAALGNWPCLVLPQPQYSSTVCVVYECAFISLGLSPSSVIAEVFCSALHKCVCVDYAPLHCACSLLSSGSKRWAEGGWGNARAALSPSSLKSLSALQPPRHRFLTHAADAHIDSLIN